MADETQLTRRLQPIAGSIATCLPLKLGEYLALVEWTGKQVRPDKRGAIPKNAPSVLQRFESNPDRWAVRVKAIGSGYWRIVGETQDLVAWAARLHQRWIKGIGLTTRLAKAD